MFELKTRSFNVPVKATASNQPSSGLRVPTRPPHGQTAAYINAGCRPKRLAEPSQMAAGAVVGHGVGANDCDSVTRHADRVREACGRAAAAIVEMGRRLREARDELEPLGCWSEFLSKHVKLRKRSARMLMRIGSYSPFGRGDNVAALPADQQSLAALTRLPENQFQDFLAENSGSIGSMPRTEVKAAVDRWLHDRDSATTEAPSPKALQNHQLRQIHKVAHFARRLENNFDRTLQELRFGELSDTERQELCALVDRLWAMVSKVAMRLESPTDPGPENTQNSVN